MFFSMGLRIGGPGLHAVADFIEGCAKGTALDEALGGIA